MGIEAGERVNGVAADTYDWFRVSWFVRLLAAKGSQAKHLKPALSAVEAQLSLLNHNIAKEPQKHGNAKKLAANYETTNRPRSEN